MAKRFSSQSKFLKKIAVPLVLFLLLQCVPVQAWPWQWNRYDNKLLKNGRWRVYHDEGNKVLQYTGKYRHGKEVGKWKTYAPDGKLYFKERIRLKKKNIKTVYYHPNGKVSHKGLAYLRESEKGGAVYYWDGDWDFFDANGAYLGVKTYVKGSPLSEVPVLGNVKKSK